MALLTQSTYSIKRIPKENYRFDISPETISLPSKADGSDTDYSTAKANLKLSYDGKEIYPNYDERLEDEIGGRNLLLNSRFTTVPTKGVKWDCYRRITKRVFCRHNAFRVCSEILWILGRAGEVYSLLS